MTLEEFVTRLEKFRVEPEEEFRIDPIGSLTDQTPQTISAVERLMDEDGNWFVSIHVENT